MNRNIKPLKESKKEMLFSGLHVLLTAGLDFSHSFRLLIEEEKEEKIRLLLKEIYASVVDGAYCRSVGFPSGLLPQTDRTAPDDFGGGKLSGHHLGDRLGGFGVYGHCYCADVRAGICPYGK